MQGAPGGREALLANAPGRYFVAAYSSPGWVAIDLDAPGTTPDEVAELLTESYCLVAPKKLAAMVRRT